MTSTSSKAAAAPILRLFRDILRVHREKLAGGMKELGNAYVKSEFRSHLKSPKTTQPQWKQFVGQWQTYLQFLRGEAADKAPMINTSGELSEEVLEAMSPDQRKRMELLKEEARKLGGADS